MRTANVLDYVRSSLDSEIWELDGEITLQPAVQDDVEDVVYSFLDDVDIPADALQSIFIYGSILTKQWNKKTDVDCRILLNREYMDENMPGVSGDDLFDMSGESVHGILLADTEHPLNCTIVVDGEMPELGQTDQDPVYDVLDKKVINDPVMEDPDFDPDEEFSGEKDDAREVMDRLDKLIQETTIDTIDFTMIEDAIGGVGEPGMLTSKLEEKLQAIEADIEELANEYEDIKDGRTQALTDDAKSDYEKSKHWAPGNLMHKYLERYQYLDILQKLKKVLKDGIEEDEVDDVRDALRLSGQLMPEDLRRGMSFEDPYGEAAHVRDRRNWRWVSPEIQITNVRRYGETPEDIVIYYEDSGGNKWKSDAAWFAERFGDHLKTADFYTGPAAPTETNPASYDGGGMMHGGSCPNCGFKNKSLQADDDGNVTCTNCGKVFKACLSINTAPDEEFLVGAQVFPPMTQDTVPNDVAVQNPMTDLERLLREKGFTSEEIDNVIDLLTDPAQTPENVEVPEQPQQQGLKPGKPMKKLNRSIDMNRTAQVIPGVEDDLDVWREQTEKLSPYDLGDLEDSVGDPTGWVVTPFQNLWGISYIDKINWDVITDELEEQFPDDWTTIQGNLFVRALNPDGSLTGAGELISELAASIASYPLLDDEKLSAMEMEADFEAVSQQLYSSLGENLPEGWEGMIMDKMSEWNEYPEHSEDYNGGVSSWWNEDKLMEAARELGFLEPDLEEFEQGISDFMEEILSTLDIQYGLPAESIVPLGNNRWEIPLPIEQVLPMLERIEDELDAYWVDFDARSMGDATDIQFDVYDPMKE